MGIDEVGEQRSMVLLIEQVATHNQIEFPQKPISFPPTGAHKWNIRILVQMGVFKQKIVGFRVVVSGGDVRAAMVEHQTGQTDTAADF